MPTATASARLKWEVLVTNRQGLTRDLPPGKEQWTWVPTSATLIFGQRDAVLVDAFLTVEQAAALVEWVAASGKNLTTIYVTHGHGDHFFGIGAVLNRFPNARAMATPNVVKSMRQQVSQDRSEEHTSELQSLRHLVCRLLLEKKKKTNSIRYICCTNM